MIARRHWVSTIESFGQGDIERLDYVATGPSNRARKS
jgi:hypothetical protein